MRQTLGWRLATQREFLFLLKWELGWGVGLEVWVGRRFVGRRFVGRRFVGRRFGLAGDGRFWVLMQLAS
jgi:hypothetical protein